MRGRAFIPGDPNAERQPICRSRKARGPAGRSCSSIAIAAAPAADACAFTAAHITDIHRHRFFRLRNDASPAAVGGDAPAFRRPVTLLAKVTT